MHVPARFHHALAAGLTALTIAAAPLSAVAAELLDVEAAHSGRLGFRAGMAGVEVRVIRGQRASGQRPQLHHRKARRQGRRAVPERRQHGQRRDEHANRARPFLAHLGRLLRHRRRRRPDLAYRRRGHRRPVGPVSRGGVRARDVRRLRHPAMDAEAGLCRLWHDRSAFGWRHAQEGIRRGGALLVRERPWLA